MKFILTKASNFNFEEEVNIDNLDDLKMLSERYNKRLILDFNSWWSTKDGKYQTIIIYDDYIE